MRQGNREAEVPQVGSEKAILCSWMEKLIGDPPCSSFPALITRLSDLRAMLGHVAAGELSLVVVHLLFLLEDGRPLFEACAIQVDAHMRPWLVAERVSASEDGVEKLVVRLGQAAAEPAHDDLAVYGHGPSIVVRKGPVRIMDAPAEALDIVAVGPVRPRDLAEYYRTRQTITDHIRQSATVLRDTDAAIAEDRRLIATIFEQLRMRAPGTAPGRMDHPYRGPHLHILPRLVRTDNGRSSLAAISDALGQVAAMNFDGVLLGGVDPQSTDLYLQETDGGEILCHVNTHGYWSSGNTGIDPVIGTADDYGRLRTKAANLGLSLMQDSVIGSLGYPPQLARLAPPGSAATPTSLIIGGEPTSIWDRRCFLNDFCIPDEDVVSGDCSPSIYAEIISQTHVGAPFNLPKPNLFDPAILDASLGRARRQAEAFGVTAFRVDMAKHMGVRQLTAVIAGLRAAAGSRQGLSDGFAVLLEYWSPRYRDLAFTIATLGSEAARVYLIDVPLGVALQDIFVRGYDWIATLHQLIESRTRWGIDIARLVPVFIDHDGFRPIYDGSAVSRDIVVAGVALASMLSANGPNIYFGYDDRRVGAGDPFRYFDMTDHQARQAVTQVFADDLASPASSIAELFGAISAHRLLADWRDGKLTVGGDSDRLTITRRWCSLVDGTERGLVAEFRRGSGADRGGDTNRLIFASGAGPSVALFLSE